MTLKNLETLFKALNVVHIPFFSPNDGVIWSVVQSPDRIQNNYWSDCREIRYEYSWSGDHESYLLSFPVETT